MNLQRILYDMISNSAPILFCVLGGNFAYKANVLNIALEGLLLMGAFLSTIFVLLTNNIFVGVVLSLVINLVIGLVFAYMSISRKGNPIIAGLAINLLASSVTAFVLKTMGLSNINVNSIVDVAGIKINIPFIKDIPFIGGVISGHSPLTYLSFIAIYITWIIMFKTRFGVYVRVVGENEEAAISVGINSKKIKYIAVLIGAGFCTLGGINLAMEKLALFTNGMSAGIGFIAIAAIFCGQGIPLRTSLYAILFGLCQALSVNMNISAGPASGLFKTLPYFMIVIILAIVSATRLKNNKIRGI